MLPPFAVMEETAIEAAQTQQSGSEMLWSRIPRPMVAFRSELGPVRVDDDIFQGHTIPEVAY